MMQALEAKANDLGWETIEIADGEGDAQDKKVRVETRFRLAGKVDRARWGEKVDHIGVMLDPLSEMLREISERRLAAMRSGNEVVINQVPQAAVGVAGGEE